MAFFKNKRVMGIVMVLIGVLCIISSFYTWKTSDPMEWVLTEEGRAVQIMAMLIFCFGFIIFFIGIGILILTLWKGKSLKKNRNPLKYQIPVIYPPQQLAIKPQVNTIPMVKSICPICGLPLEINMKTCQNCEKGGESRESK